MSNRTTIEWTQQTWNPTVGCTKVSAGCINCYAESMAKRLKAMGAKGYDNGFGLTLMPERIAQPLHRKKPTLYFVNSMSDLFHEDIPDSYIDQVLETIEKTPWHTYQILTKRSQRLANFFSARKPPKNAWIGVTVEDKKSGIPRIENLRQVPATIRFLSVEPLLEDLGGIDLNGIHWLIAGGESGPKARPMKPDWVRSLLKQAQKAHCAFFFKQWGTFGADGVRRAKKNNGKLLDGRIWQEYPLLLPDKD